jgi:glycosyltransferase involved in cell wall biosynthesis
MNLSFIITSYNYERYVKECIESIVNQPELISYEIIIIDDGSTDNTKSLVTKIASIYPNIKFYSIENSGIEMASNYGILLSSGRYICRVDADDYLLPNFIHDMLPGIKKESDIVYSNYVAQELDTSTSIKLPRYSRKEIEKRGDFLATGTIYKRNSLALAGYYNASEKNCGLENYDLILRMIKNSPIVEKVDKETFVYRLHEKSISNMKREKIIKNGHKLASTHGLVCYSTNCYHPYNLNL